MIRESPLRAGSLRAARAHEPTRSFCWRSSFRMPPAFSSTLRAPPRRCPCPRFFSSRCSAFLVSDGRSSDASHDAHLQRSSRRSLPTRPRRPPRCSPPLPTYGHVPYRHALLHVRAPPRGAQAFGGSIGLILFYFIFSPVVCPSLLFVVGRVEHPFGCQWPRFFSSGFLFELFRISSISLSNF